MKSIDPALPLTNPRRERFVQIVAIGHANGKRATTAAAFEEAFDSRAGKKSCEEQARKLMQQPEVKLRLSYLLEDAQRRRFSQVAFGQDRVEQYLIEIVERCLQSKRVSMPPELKGTDVQPCGPCGEASANPEKWCEPCQHNWQLLAQWRDFGGIYEFNARDALKSLEMLGKERGMFVEKRRIEHAGMLDNMDRDSLAALLVKEVTNLGYIVTPRETGVASGAEGASDESSADLHAASQAAGVSPSRVH